MEANIGATWRIQPNHSRAAAMQPDVKLLSPLVVVLTCRDVESESHGVRVLARSRSLPSDRDSDSRYVGLLRDCTLSLVCGFVPCVVLADHACTLMCSFY